MKKTDFFEKFTVGVVPKVFSELLGSYFRVEVEGLEYLPRRGKMLVISNHSGCMGLDAIVLGRILQKELGRVPRILTLWTALEGAAWLDAFARKLGLREASAQVGIDLLKRNHVTVIFPEGVGGSFKPSAFKYQLQEFKTGFIRMAVLTRAPVVPCVIIGAEESNINLGMLNLDRANKQMILPIPVNFFPLPSKWKIRFLPPMEFNTIRTRDAYNRKRMHEIAEKVRLQMQRVVDLELSRRKYVFFGTSEKAS